MNGGDAGEIGSRISCLECVKGQLPGEGVNVSLFILGVAFIENILSCISAVIRVFALLIANYCGLMNNVNCAKSSQRLPYCFLISVEYWKLDISVIGKISGFW